MGTPSTFATESMAADDDRAVRGRLWRHLEGPDPAWLARLAGLERVSLTLVFLVAGIILAAWLFPALDKLLFPGWALMKANTALLLLLSAASLVLSQPQASIRGQRASQALALVGGLVAAAVLVEYLAGVSLGIDTLLAADAGSPRPGTMSPQTAIAFVLLAAIMLFIRADKRPLVHVVDGLVFALCPLVLVIVSGYLFGVVHLFGLSASTRTSPHTLFCLMLLSFLVFARRAEFGIFSILVGSGIGSRMARLASPLALVVPFLLEAGRLATAHSGLMSAAYATALVTALAGVMGFALILVLAWRMDTLERRIRELSLRDDLTGLYNRRGFFMFAEREFKLANRSKVPFCVLFIDLDGLKQVNDRLGHDAGSEFLREVASLLKRSFRESDIVARIGGDEFVVAGVLGAAGVVQATLRLERAAAERNAQEGQAYPLSFSLGHVVSDLDRPQTLEELLNRADSAMYARKRDKKMAR